MENNPLFKFRSYTIMAAIAWTAIAIGLMWVNWNWMQDHILEIARAEARASIDKDILYRGWNSRHGGVYVPVTDETPPNPYLEVPEREITTPSGRLLTLMNPAYMTRQVYEIQDASGIRAHLTSLKPFNPNNIADEWESKALQTFENGTIEVSSVEVLDGEEYLRLMRPFITTEACLKCHANQGYKVGDVRGGLSVSVPMSKYANIKTESGSTIVAGYGLLWLLGLGGIFTTSNSLKKRLDEREALMKRVQVKEKEYHDILRTSMEGFWLVDQQGRIIEVNDAYCQMSGYSREELLTMEISDVELLENAEETQKHLQSVRDKGAERFESVQKNKNGKYFMVEVSARSLENGNNAGFLRDITEQKRAQDQLRASEQKFSKMFQRSPAMVTLSSLADGRYVDVNQKFLEISGFTRDEVIGKTSVEAGVINPADREKVKRLILSEGRISNLKLSFQKKNGVEIICIYNGEILELNGESLLLSLMQDVTEQTHTEKALKESVATIGAILNVAPLSIIWVDMDEKIRSWNDAAETMFGWTAEEVIGKPNPLIPAQFKDEYERLGRDILTTSKPLYNYETIRQRKDGTLIDVSISSAPMPDAEGNITGRMAIIADITQQKSSKKALLESEERFRTLVTSSDDIIFTLDTQEKHTGIYGKWLEKLNIQPGYFIGRTSIEIMGEDAGSIHHKANEQALRGENIVYEWQSVDEHNNVLYYQTSLSPIYDHNGHVVGLVGIGHDITHQKSVENILRESEENLKEAQAIAQIGSYALDIHTGYWRSSDVMNAIFGIDETYERSVEGWAGLIHPEDQLMMTEYFSNEVLGNKTAFNKEYRIIRQSDGVERWVHGRGKLEFDEQGNPIRMIGTIQDITERKQAEIEREQFYSFFQLSTDIMVIADPNGCFKRVNPACVNKLKYQKDELLSKSFIDFVHPEDRQSTLDEMARQIQIGYSLDFENRYVCKDGTVRWLSWRASYVKEENTTYATARDITEQKKVEQALRTSEDKFRKAFLISPDSININRLADGMYVTINEGFTQTTGYTLEDCIGKTSVELKIWASSEDREKFVNDLLKNGEVKNLETRFRIKDGQVKYGLLSASMLELDGETHIISITRDISERKEAEIKILEKSRELETLFNISSHLRTAQNAEEMIPVVLDQMSQMLHSDANALIMLSEDHKHFDYLLGSGMLSQNTGKRFTIENSISGRMMTTLEPYTTLDFANDNLRSNQVLNTESLGPAAIVPLQSEKEFVGTLLCARAKNSPMGAFTPAEVRLLSAIGEMVGNALRRAKLYDDAIIRLQRVQALRAIDAAINSNMDPVITLRILINQTLSMLKVDAAATLLYNPATHMLECAAAHGFRSREIENAHTKINYKFASAVIIERRMIKAHHLKECEDPIYKEIAIKEDFESCHIVPMIAKGQVCGIFEVYSRSMFNPNQEWLDFLEALSGQAAIAINNAQLFTNLEKSNLELSLAYDATIEGWSKALELRDRETEGHTLRVTEWTLKLAKLAGLNETELVNIRRGALLHDIGKMGVPDKILNKAGKLTENEWEIMRQHPQFAYNMIQPITFLGSAVEIPYSHHERWDGNGYPRRLKGNQIPFAARIFSVIDVWDAVTSDRPYRKAWSIEKAIEHITAEAGKQFDPQIVSLFIENIDRFKERNKLYEF